MRFLEIGENFLSPSEKQIAPLILGGIIAAGASLAGNLIGSSSTFFLANRDLTELVQH